MKPVFVKLKKRDVQEILISLNNMFGINPEIFKENVFYRTGKESIWITTPQALDLIPSPININNIGINFMKIDSRGDMRLTLDGTTLFGKHATKNVIQITDEEFDYVIRGIDLSPKPELEPGYYILKHEKDFIGCAKNSNTKILVYTPKNRRIKNLDF